MLDELKYEVATQWKHLLSSTSTPHWALRGSCCLPGAHYLTRKRATAKDKRWQEVLCSVPGTFLESEKRSRSLFSCYKEHACLPITCPLSPVPGSLLSGFRIWGLPQPPHGDAAWMSDQVWRLPKQSTQRESSWASELTFPVRTSPPSWASLCPSIHSAPTHPKARVSCPHASQGCPLPESRSSPLPGFLLQPCPSLHHA